MQYLLPVTNIEIIMPFVCASIIFFCSFMSFYMYIKILKISPIVNEANYVSSGIFFRVRYLVTSIFQVKASVYIIVFLVGIVGLVMSVCFGVLALIGFFDMGINLGMRFWRVMNISSTTLLVLVPLYIRNSFTLSKTLNSLLDKMATAFLIVVPVIITIAFIKPDWFVSVTTQDPTGSRFIRQSAYGRGISGIFFEIQNIIFFITMVVALIALFYNLSKNRLFIDDILPTLGVIVMIIGGAEDLISFRANTYVIFPNLLFSRSSLGITLFILTIMIKLFKFFIDNAVDFKNTQNELRSKYDKDITAVSKIIDVSCGIKDRNDKLIKYSKRLINLSNESSDVINTAKEHVDKSYIASNSFLSISKVQKNTIDEINDSAIKLFDSLGSVKTNIETQQDKITSSIDNIMVLTNTIDSMKYTINQIISIAFNLEQYTIERKTNILSTFEKLENVEQISKEVFQTINFIKDIANRTNLLSINADIHASKAGDLGRGFSVVSHEIGILSTSSHVGIEHIETLLTYMAQTLESVNEIKGYVFESFNEIVRKVKNISVSIEEIVESIKKQTEDNEIIKEDIERLNSTIEMIIKSIHVQDEYCDNIKSSITSMLSQFDLISDKSMLQIIDIDSVKNDINMISDDINLFFTYAKNVHDLTRTIDHINTDLISRLNKVVYLEEHSGNKKLLNHAHRGGLFSDENKKWFDDSSDIDEIEDDLDYTNVQDNIDSLIQEYKIKNEDEKEQEDDDFAEVSQADIEMRNFIKEAKKVEKELDDEIIFENKNEKETISDEIKIETQENTESLIEKDSGAIDKTEKDKAVDKEINDIINAYIEKEEAKLAASKNKEIYGNNFGIKKAEDYKHSESLPNNIKHKENDINEYQNTNGKNEYKGDATVETDKTNFLGSLKKEVPRNDSLYLLTDEYIEDLDAALNKYLEIEKEKL